MSSTLATKNSLFRLSHAAARRHSGVAAGSHTHTLTAAAVAFAPRPRRWGEGAVIAGHPRLSSGLCHAWRQPCRRLLDRMWSPSCVVHRQRPSRVLQRRQNFSATVALATARPAASPLDIGGRTTVAPAIGSVSGLRRCRGGTVKA